jgi:hypothetical protein
VSSDPRDWTGYNAAGLDDPAGAVSAALGEASSDGGAWAFAFSTRFVIGIHASARDASPLAPRTPWAVAQAAAGWALRGSEPQPWQAGPGIVQREVCVPSGLLPTRYCPATVPEVFLEGTEPNQTDTYYRPAMINRETGRLATLWTPLALTEQKVFFQLSGEARHWAEQSGFPLPPEAYDTLPASFPFQEDLQILQPGPMDVLHGTVNLRVTVAREGMTEFQLQAGQGLYPSEWFILAEGKTAVREKTIAAWDASAEDGVWSLQLVCLFADGSLETAAIPVTLDNSPPEIHLVEPALTGQQTLRQGEAFLLQADISDNLSLAGVEFRLDGKTRTTMEVGPFAIRWESLTVGKHSAEICARDTAGNENCTPTIEILVMP